MEKEGIRHSFFEKEMRSQILTMARSSMSENAKINIQVMDNDVSEREKVDEVNHYIQQLVNSEYSVPQI